MRDIHRKVIVVVVYVMLFMILIDNLTYYIKPNNTTQDFRHLML
jgi:hypothetical protein